MEMRTHTQFQVPTLRDSKQSLLSQITPSEAEQTLEPGSSTSHTSILTPGYRVLLAHML